LSPEAWWKYLIATFGAATFLFIVVIAWPGGMGMGDVYMALLMGAVLGVSVTIALFAAFLIGAVSGIMLMLLKGYGRKTKIPFGPFLAIGSVVAVFAGETILHSYLTLYS
jgi:prepilin signal peptidase PulO-like enzyme (type II secretory pathway)